MAPKLSTGYKLGGVEFLAGWTPLMLIRHAQTSANADARWHGNEDEGISEAGRKEAEIAGERLKNQVGGSVGLVVSSHLRRAVETAEILATAVGSDKVEHDPQLAERDMGNWAGRSPAEVDLLWPGALNAWIAGKADGPPGGEPDTAVARRARQSLGQHAVGRSDLVLVITHGGVIRSLLREAGLENRPVPHLGGNWASIHPAGSELTMGPAVLLGDPVAEPLT